MMVILAIALSLYSNKGMGVLSEQNVFPILIEKIINRIIFGNAVADIYVIELIESGNGFDLWVL